MATVTISRQFGSEGLAVARSAAEILGYSYLDRMPVREAAHMADVPERLVEKYDEKGQSLLADLLELAFLGSPTPEGEAAVAINASEPQWRSARAVFNSTKKYGKPGQCRTFVRDDILSLTEWIIRTAADRGKVVIVGQGAQAILANRPDTLHVRVISPIDVRCRRITELFEVDPEDAMALIRRKDQDKACYLRQYYGVDWEEGNLYHLIINAEQTGVDMAAHLIAGGAAFVDSGRTC